MLPTEPGEEQFTLRVTENGKQIEARAIPDPFIHTTITRQQGRWDALRGAFGRKGRRVEFTVTVGGTSEANRAVFTADYSPFDKSDTGNVIAASAGDVST